MSEQCILCGMGASVRVSGTSFCAACGVDQFPSINTADHRPRGSRRAAWLAALTSSLLVKTMLGAVAVAAMTAAAGTVLQPDDGDGQEPVATATTAASSVVTETTSAGAPGVVAFADAVQDWSECVAAESGTGPVAAALFTCGAQPVAADFGLITVSSDEAPSGADPVGIAALRPTEAGADQDEDHEAPAGEEGDQGSDDIFPDREDDDDDDDTPGSEGEPSLVGDDDDDDPPPTGDASSDDEDAVPGEDGDDAPPAGDGDDDDEDAAPGGEGDGDDATSGGGGDDDDDDDDD